MQPSYIVPGAYENKYNKRNVLAKDEEENYERKYNNNNNLPLIRDQSSSTIIQLYDGSEFLGNPEASGNATYQRID